MANALKGEVEVVAGETTYILCFTNNAIVQIEQIFDGMGIGEITQNLMRVEVARALLWGALQKHHPKTDLLKAGDILDDIEGGLAAIADPLARALRFRLSGIGLDKPLIEVDG